MNHLALDTVTEVLSIALRFETPGGPRCIAAVREMGLRHAHLVMPLVDRLCREAGLRPADLDLVSCMRGPGSFTGLRIGMATAKGLAGAIGAHRGLERCPLVSVSTLDVMAGAVAPSDVCVMPVIDGRKGRFYAALYRRGTRLTGDLDLPPAELLALAADAADDAPGGAARGGPDAPGGAAQPRELIVTGPHARELVAEAQPVGFDPDHLRVLTDPGARRGYAVLLLDYAEAAVATHGYDADDQGPVYVRESDAELARASSRSSEPRRG